jgi:phosphohistidine phosphatase SixA
VLLTRHASAGERLASLADDRERRLDARGRSDARRLPAALSGHPIERIVSSPHVRCLETMEPVARLLGLVVEAREELAPGVSRGETLALLGELRDSTLVCTHREVFERLFGGEVTCEKGGTWIVEGGTPIAYLPPASSSPTARRPTTRSRARGRASAPGRRARP